MSEIPDGWATVEIEHILLPLANGNVLQQGWSPQCHADPAKNDDEWGVLKTTAIQEGLFLPEHNKRLPDNLNPRPQIEVIPGDILMTCAGPRNRCGVTCLVKATRKRLLMSGKMYRFRNNPQILNSGYLEAFLLSQTAKHAIDEMKTGINDSGLNLTHDRFKKLRIPVAPVNEQHRIVAKIEELFSELDKGVESLKTAQAQLKVYRQALLKHAFEGKLTAQWRAENQDKLETADVLLQRIQQERAARYQEQFADWQTNGGSLVQRAGKPKPPKPLPPLTTEELDELPELPKGWGWVKLGDLASKITDGEHFRPPVKTEGVYFLSAKDVKHDGVSFEEPLFIDEETAEKARSRCDPERNDILIVSRGATVGRMCIVNTDECFCLLGSVILVKATAAIQSRYFLSALKSPLVNKKIVGVSGATAQQAIYLRDIQHVPVPVCSSLEQNKIVEELESKLSEVDQLVQTVATSLQQAEALRQSILKRAFSGQLVAQDPQDEAASVLLERIRAEREVQTKSIKARGTK